MPMPSELVKRLRDRRLNVWNEARAVIEKGNYENRTLTTKEQGQWNGLNNELDDIDKRIKGVLDVEQRAKETNDLFDNIGRRSAENTPESRLKQTTELRAFLRGEAGAPRAFEVKPEGTYEQRTLSKLTTGAGGNLVPISFYDRLMAHLIEVSGILQANPTILNTDSGEQINVPKTTGHSSAALTAEAAALTASDPA